MNKVVIQPLYVRRRDLKAVIGLDPKTVDALERDGLFPRRRRLSNGSSRGWLFSELELWAQTREPAEIGA